MTRRPSMDNAFPGVKHVTLEYIERLKSNLEANTHSGVANRIQKFVSAQQFTSILNHCTEIIEKENTCVYLRPENPEETVVNVVGDTHGQFHDVLQLLELAGKPSSKNNFVFNGDFVDRGAWGCETLLTFVLMKICFPQDVILIRGNNESEFCTSCYGFERELKVKFGDANALHHIYPAFLKFCAALPLACKIGSSALVLHGGLFRSPSQKKSESKLNPKLGTLKELSAASKGGFDPSGVGRTLVAGDVMWSDPSHLNGLKPNVQRGIGVIFGPEESRAFMKNENLKLIIRSHEGPDAREDKPEMSSIQSGFCIDHDLGEDGKLVTIFSAPDYPQFRDFGDTRHNNEGAFIRLKGETNFCSVEDVCTFSATPRPPAECYYDLDIGGSDVEGPSDGSGGGLSSAGEEESSGDGAQTGKL